MAGPIVGRSPVRGVAHRGAHRSLDGVEEGTSVVVNLIGPRGGKRNERRPVLPGESGVLGFGVECGGQAASQGHQGLIGSG